jgi:tellurite resistance protein
MADPPTPLADLALLTLVVAHGTDADLDPRETRAIVEELARIAGALGSDAHSGADLMGLVEGALEAYGDVRVRGLDEVVGRLRETLSPRLLARVHAALVAVAAADGVVRTTEGAFLRHLAHAWGLD